MATYNIEIYQQSELVDTVEVSAPRGYSAYEIAVQQGYEGTEAEWNAAVNAARLATEQARDDAQQAANEAGADAQQTALDRVATGEDRVATAADRVATGQDRVATGQDVVTATTQAGIATTKAGEASDSANTATQQAGIATNRAGIASDARDEVVAIKEDIDARFLPDSSTDPSTVGLTGGELYYNTALNAYRYFNGTVFDYVTPDGDYLLL